jgi:Cu-Zn family superoxide dismutase
MAQAVAFFNSGGVEGEVLFKDTNEGCYITAKFAKLPPGEHGFHIHRAGDLRGEGCKAACDHYHKGPPSQHGGPPSSSGPRHTGDLGNISMSSPSKRYLLKGVSASDLFGRSVIVHADPDDLGKGNHEDSQTTGHSGKRIACAIIGRTAECDSLALKRNRKTQRGSSSNFLFTSS